MEIWFERALLHSVPPWHGMVQTGKHETPGCKASPVKAVLGGLDAWLLLGWSGWVMNSLAVSQARQMS